MVIACDVDDVACDLVTEWIRLYNRDYFDTLSTPDITEWNIVKFVKPECGDKIYDYLDNPSLYDTIYPVERSIDGVIALRNMGHRVVFVTSAVNGCAGRKLSGCRIGDSSLNGEGLRRTISSAATSLSLGRMRLLMTERTT